MIQRHRGGSSVAKLFSSFLTTGKDNKKLPKVQSFFEWVGYGWRKCHSERILFETSFVLDRNKTLPA
jgi:hypothetical protein